MDQSIRELFFFWRIENYSNYWHKNGDTLKSPVFFANFTGMTAWTLRLCPTGSEDEELISFSLCREDDDGPERLSLNAELSFLALDGSALYSCAITGHGSHLFERGSHTGNSNFLRTDEVLLLRRAEYLPLDTLTACCRMRILEEDSKHRICSIYARTRIGIETVSTLQEIEHFSTVLESGEKSFIVRSHSRNRHILTVRLWFDDRVMAEIIPEDSEQTTPSSCKFTLIDAKGKSIECGQTNFRFHGKTEGTLRIPLSLTKTTLINQRSLYLPLDTLSLRFEYCFSNELELHKIEKTEYTIVTPDMRPLSGNPLNRRLLKSENISDISSTLKDFKEVYNSQVLSDIKLKTETETFSAHKAMLCARSPVFRSMLERNTEKNVDCIEVDDMEDDILRRFLLFLYTDALENLQWDQAIKLYRVACKYQVRLLKMQCSSFLIQNVKTTDVSELLLLAVDHHDFDLKVFVDNFIAKYYYEIFYSEEWDRFSVSHPSLAAEIITTTLVEIQPSSALDLKQEY